MKNRLEAEHYHFTVLEVFHFPTTNYVADYLPLSIGLHSTKPHIARYGGLPGG